MQINNTTSKRTYEINPSLFEQVKKPEMIINFLKTVTNTQNISFNPPELYKRFIKKIQKTKSKIADNISLYEKTLRCFRKSHGLPKELFDQDVIVRSTNKTKHLFSKELLILSSTYFRVLFTSGCKESIPKNGIYTIQPNLSNKAIKSLLDYFCSKNIPSEDVNVLHELLSFASLMGKKSLAATISEKIITILIEEKNRAQFSLRAVRGLENLFLEGYLANHNISIEPTHLKFSVDLIDLLKLFCVDDALSQFLLAHLNSVRFDSTDYAVLYFLPERCRKSIHKLVFTPIQENLEEVFEHVHSLFPNLEHIQIKQEAVIEEYLKTHTDTPFLKGFLGAYYLSKKQEDHSKAISLLEESHTLNPKCTFTLATLGSYFQKKGDLNKAIPLLKRALEINPNHITSLAYFADYFRQKGEFNKAISLLKKALKINPSYNVARNILITCYQKKGSLNKAIPLLKEDLKTNPKSSFALTNLATCFTRKGDHTKAIPFLEKALKINPESDFILTLLGTCHRRKGEPDKAVPLLKKALEINPSSDFTLQSLQKCFKETDQI